MRAIVVGAAVILAGCSEPPGISLEIAADDASITTVEVYVGEHCDDCPGGMRPPQLSPKAADLYLVTDPKPWVATVEGGVAGIRIESDVETDIPVLVLVGFDAAHTPKATHTLYGLHISPTEAEVWHTSLSPASPLTDVNAANPPPPAGTERIAIWKSPDQTLPACVMVEHWDGDSVSRDALVPDDDRDCDGVTPMQECAMYSPNAIGITATIEQASCLLPIDDIRPLCMLGGPPCTENPIAPTNQCDYLDEDYCLPLQLCTCAPAETGCIDSLVYQGYTSQTSSYLRCTLPVQPDGSNCPDYDPAVAELDASPMLQGSSTKCEDIGVHDSAGIAGGFGHHATLGTSTFKLTSFEEPCKSEVEWSGTLPMTPTGTVLYTFGELELDNGKHLVLPFIIDRGDCSRPPMCAAVRIVDGGSAMETMFACTEPAPSSESCMPMPPCAGPMCGGTCCGAGEACVDGVCRCGALARCAGDQICGGGPASADACGNQCR